MPTTYFKNTVQAVFRDLQGSIPKDDPVRTIPIIKEGEECKFYSKSELRSHLSDSYYEDPKTDGMVFVFKKSNKKMPREHLKNLQQSLPVRATQYSAIGYHPDGFWYAVFNNNLVWCTEKVTTETPQLNRYNALTLKKGED